MVKNNHDLNELESTLLDQYFAPSRETESVEDYKQIAAFYAKIENAIAVLSDLMSNKSYIYNGALAHALGLSQDSQQIESIWEEEIYSRIHPDDLTLRNLQELHYFILLKKIPIEERYNYRTYSTIRMKNAKGVYIPIIHRTLYLHSQSNGALWLALCLYNFSFNNLESQSFSGEIQNCATGEFIRVKEVTASILSEREVEVLKFVEKGYLSKEIATLLGVSIYTINRHRQNIIEKLRVYNSFEAIKVARALKILI